MRTANRIYIFGQGEVNWTEIDPARSLAWLKLEQQRVELRLQIAALEARQFELVEASRADQEAARIADAGFSPWDPNQPAVLRRQAD